MRTVVVRNLLLCASLVLGAGCASGPTPVDCEGRLEPINTPAPKEVPRRAGMAAPGETRPAGKPPRS